MLSSTSSNQLLNKNFAIKVCNYFFHAEQYPTILNIFQKYVKHFVISSVLNQALFHNDVAFINKNVNIISDLKDAINQLSSLQLEAKKIYERRHFLLNLKQKITMNLDKKLENLGLELSKNNRLTIDKMNYLQLR